MLNGNGFFKHGLRTFGIFILLLALALAFWGIEKACIWLGAPVYIILAAHWIPIALVCLDAIVFLSSAVFWTVAIVVRGWYNMRGEIKGPRK